MAGSSPARQSYTYQASSPLSDILYADRNSEARHRQILEASRREHERVRQIALTALEDHLRDEERRRVAEEERRQQERIRKEEALAAEKRKLQALKQQKVKQQAPHPESPPATTPQPAAAPTPKPAPSGFPNKSTNNAPLINPPSQPQPSVANGVATQNPSRLPPTTAHTQKSLFAQAAPTAARTPSLLAQSTSPFGAGSAAQNHTLPKAPTAPALNPFAQPQQAQTALSQQNATSQLAKPAPPARAPQARPDRYEIIHQNLKHLRQSMLHQAKHNMALKGRMGDMRREIRKCVGQLIHGPPSANRSQLNGIVALMHEALANRVQSLPFDPSDLVLEPRGPMEGPVNNGALLPSLFLYLLNIFAKAGISQFVNEAGAKPETADPVGVTIVAVFAEKDFLWRGRSLIDILLAKFRVACPVLFGHHGNEKYEEGRRRLGWQRDGDTWIPEQQHFDRMTGLGAGFAAISLRNFAKSKTKTNPYPPSKYWTAMARIVNTAPADMSNTQAIVLKAMIQHYETKFLDAYGSAGVAALRLALVDFPAKAPTKTPAFESLEVVAQLLKKETGLSLA